MKENKRTELTRKIIKFQKPFGIIEYHGPRYYIDHDLDSVFINDPGWGAVNRALNSGNNHSDRIAGKIMADLPFRYEVQILKTEDNLRMILSKANNLESDFIQYFIYVMIYSKFKMFDNFEPEPKLRQAVDNFCNVVLNFNES